MNSAIYQWAAFLKRCYPDLFINRRVFECGSAIYNGSLRQFFENSEYVGVDVRVPLMPWPHGVDWTGLIHEYDEKPDGYFDTIVSTSQLEYDPYWKKTLDKMSELLCPLGNMIIVTSPTPLDTRDTSVYLIDNYIQGRAMQDITSSLLNNASYHTVLLEAIDRRHIGCLLRGKA